MTVPVVPLPTLDDLYTYVKQTLCAHDRLEVESTPLFAAPVMRGSRCCGYLFHIEGPRQMKNSALWSEEENRIFFYDSAGARFHEVRLSEAPAIDEKPVRRAA
jgi:hypothetical protein